MSEPKKPFRKRRIFIVVEVVLIVLLTCALGVSAWASHKLSLVHYEDINHDQLYVSDINSTTNTADATTAAPDADGQGQDTTQEQENPGLTGFELIALVGVDTRGDLNGAMGDCMIVCCLDHSNKQIRLASIYRDTYLNIGNDYYGNPDYYFKANEAYNFGGATQMLSMLNMNFDLNMDKYVTVDFAVLTEIIDLLGGLDIDMTREECCQVNDYNVETAAAANVEYVAVDIPSSDEFDGAMTRTFHLNGSQSVSYARIRKTEGNDYRRAARQRLVLSKIFEKAKAAGLSTINNMLNAVLPNITTNLESTTIMSLLGYVLTYDMPQENQAGFPKVRISDNSELTGTDCDIPVTLEYNAKLLHEFLFPGVPYTPSDKVQEISNNIIYMSGYGESYIEEASQSSDDGTIPVWTEENQKELEAKWALGLDGTDELPEGYQQ